MNAIDKIRSTADGLKILHDWLGDGGRPVDPELANHRAEICVSCPFNSSAGYVKQISADIIKSHLKVRHSSDLTTKSDVKLHLCTVCTCIIGLKIWVPFEHIRAFTPDKQLNKFPSWCWIKKEAHANY